LTDIKELCHRIFCKIGVANVPNILTISDKIAFKNEKEKLNFDIFARVLLSTINDIVVKSDWNSLLYVNAYHLTNKFYNSLSIAHLDVKCAFEKYLLDLRELYLKENLDGHKRT
jgi:hypothetical protein